MQLYNIKHNDERVSYAQAVKQGLGKDQGLFFPEVIKEMDNVEALLELPFVERSTKILAHLIGDELPELPTLVKNAFAFGAPLAKVDENNYALELFHGPTLAFKDFGGRFMAQCLGAIADGKKVTILTATSGDTGAAVAHAFYKLPGIDVVILYPKGKISNLQEKLFCTLGENIRTVAINAAFDDCQALVKQAFDDQELKVAIGLNSANSINISRLLAQVCYYFEAVAQLPKDKRNNVVVSVPSGNFGDITAGLIAKALGLNIKKFVVATNDNDTVPRYLESGNWDPNPTVATLSNAMDVSKPNNWPRVEELFKVKGWSLKELGYGKLSDDETKLAMKETQALGYITEPHGAIAYKVLQNNLEEGDVGIFLCTAHPAKFKESVDSILGTDIDLPEALATRANLDILSDEMEADFAKLREYLLNK
ncbi:MAG: threonine synthase [Ruminobacter sp.]|nr:threonine synthase [Ruminobacter sp.]